MPWTFESAVGADCTLDVHFLPLAVGVRTAGLTLNGNASTNPAATFTGTATDFQMAPPRGRKTSATVTAGQTASIALQLSAVNGFTGTVTLGCANGAVRGRLQRVGTAAVPFTVNVTTMARSLMTPMAQRGSHRRFPTLPMAIACLLALVTLSFGRPRDRKSRVLRPIVALSLLLLSSCRGGGSSTPPPSGTPAGTYTMQATATMGGTTRTRNLPITVQ